MFTGIIERLGEIVSVLAEGTNITYGIKSDLSSSLKVDQSVSHNGICLTVIKIIKDVHYVTAIDETIQKTIIKNWNLGDLLNIERCLSAEGRFDGHFVYGHVDETGICKSIKNKDGSYVLDIQFNSTSSNVVVEKGSICLNGISLTVFNTNVKDGFSVAIIPYTWDNTMLQTLQEGDEVNLEFDIIGKYISKFLKK
jgi:riboflavin synthase